MGFQVGFFNGDAGIFLVWVLQVGLGLGLPMGLSVGLGLRDRLLGFWVFRWVFHMDLSVGWGLRYRLLWFGC